MTEYIDRPSGPPFRVERAPDWRDRITMVTTPDPVYMATCTPNSAPYDDGRVEHGFQINVLDDGLSIIETINLPEWEEFRPASAGHRLIEHGFMIRPDGRGPETVNGWRPMGSGWITQVIRNPYE